MLLQILSFLVIICLGYPPDNLRKSLFPIPFLNNFAFIMKKQKNCSTEQFFCFLYFGAGRGIRTPTLVIKHRSLKPTCLPIPPLLQNGLPNYCNPNVLICQEINQTLKNCFNYFSLSFCNCLGINHSSILL